MASTNGPLVLTKKVTAEQRAYAASVGLVLHETELFSTEPLPYVWPSAVGTALFTSARAALSLGADADRLAGTPLFCVGTRAAAVLTARGLRVTAAGFETAQALAAFLGQFPLRTPVVHFCGADRRPELRNSLQAHGTALEELPVYARVPAAFQPLPEPHAGVVFFSPRGVARFFEAGPNAAAYDKPVFALGPSTAAALGQLGLRPSATPPPAPDVFALFDTLASFYQTQPVG